VERDVGERPRLLEPLFGKRRVVLLSLREDA
jgi:hypothetical protein